MALIHSFESSGNFLFKYRGQFPVLLFLVSIPFVNQINYQLIDICIQSTMLYLGVLFCLFGFGIRVYTIGTTPKGTSGRNTLNQVAEQLNSKGIYSIVRHPLYLGNYFMWAGIVIYTLNFNFFIIFSLAYWLYYERIMYAEERFLERKFGTQYLEWSLKVPAFIPSFSKFEKGPVSFSFIPVFRREYSGVLATVLGFVFIQLLKNYTMTKHLLLSKNFTVVLAVSVICTLILRSLKHYTKILDDTEKE